MTVYDNSIIRAMKQAYRGEGYDVAAVGEYIVIRTHGWGVMIDKDDVPNGIKSLIVLHNGAMPEDGTAVNLAKRECASVIPEVVTSVMDNLLDATQAVPINPTRLMVDGLQVWQETKTLEVKLVHPDNQQILDCIDCVGMMLVNGYLFQRTRFGGVYVLPEIVIPEDKRLLNHIAQIQLVGLGREA